MNASEALALIEQIPTENIITRQFSNEIDKCCVIGHLTRLTSEDPTDYSKDNCNDILKNGYKNHETLARYEGSTIRELSSKFCTDEGLYSYRVGFPDLSAINNDLIPEYNQPTPKERSVAFLKDMIKAGY